MADSTAVNKAFTAQSAHYDADDTANPVIADLRKQVYAHIQRYITPNSNVLELNAGTGIDASWLVEHGHTVLATDISDGMINAITSKIQLHGNGKKLRARQLAYDQIDLIKEEQFDFIFSNFGGLNCIKDLNDVTKHIGQLIKPGSYVCFVIMPPNCPGEMLSALKGNSTAFRRWKKDGVMAHLEGHHFKTYYHSLGDIRKAFGDDFKLISSEGLAAISPPPHRGDFPGKHPSLYEALRKMDLSLNRVFPFNRCADHIIVTFRYGRV
jgi:SAM-dependent methyltransferase